VPSCFLNLAPKPVLLPTPCRPQRPLLCRSSIRRPHPAKSFRIRTSTTPLPQVLYNPHLNHPLGSADSKALAAAAWRPQVLSFPHLHEPLGSAGNKGLITSLKSALTKNSPVTSLKSALTKNRGEGVPSLKPKAFIAPRSISLSAPYLFTFLRRVPNGRRTALPL